MKMLPEKGRDLLCVWILTPTPVSELLRDREHLCWVGDGNEFHAVTQEEQELSEDTE